MASTSNTGETVFYLALAAGAAYLAYQLVQGVKGLGAGAATAAGAVASGAKSAVNTVSSSIANAIISATLPPAMVPTGQIQLPGGGQIPVSAVTLLFDELSNSAYFTWQGNQYLVTASSPSGGMTAELIGAAP